MVTFRLVAVLLAVSTSFAERISVLPDVSWQRSLSSGSGGSGVVQEANVRPSLISRDNSFSSSGSGSFFSSNSKPSFAGDSNSDIGNSNSRFPITGGSTFNSGSSSRGSVSSFGSGISGSGDNRFPITGRSHANSNPGSGVISSGSDVSASDANRRNYVRIIAALVRFNNSRSLTSTGSSCSTFGHCDPLVFTDIDTERPNAAWPGARDTKLWPQVFAAKDKDNLDININITKDICDQTYREADLRVRIEDKKTLFSNAVINEFDCPINRIPQESEFSATWSPAMECLPRFQPGKMILTYRFKVFYVSRFLCGATTPSTTTARSG